jgi:tetratricopeptide (TPR) repeat protein/predicted Ser/Thr protein kinase
MIKLMPGDILQQRYRVVKLLGEGGFGAVYLAEDVRLQGRRIALKISFDNSSDAEKQFSFEAGTLARLHHQGLPTVSDYFVETGGQLFLVMDYIEGQDLTDVVTNSRKPVSEAEALNWIIQICEAVAHLHEQPKPIIHRDIKPPNIKITSEGRAVLVDFGIAKQFTPGKRTAKIAKAFSPGFSPKEQYIGTTDARADVYALGATLYCLLTRRVPPDAFEERFLAKTPLPSPRQFNPHLSPALEQVIMRAMALEAQYRYRNARELLQALQACQGPGAGTTVSCPRCGYANRTGVRFCVRDGTPLSSSGGGYRPAVQSPTPPARVNLVVDVAGAARHNRQGLAHSKADQIPQAVREYEQAVQLDAQNSVYHYNLAIAYRRVGRLHDALASAQQAELLESGDADYAHLIGRIYQEAKQYSVAVAAYERAIQIAPERADLYDELGETLLLNSNPADAAIAFVEAAQRDPDNAVYPFKLAYLLYRVKLYDEAKVFARDAVRLAPKSDKANNLLGMILFAGGDYQGALKAQEEAFRLSPKDATYAMNVAMDYLALGQKSKARQMAQKVLSLDPGNQDAKDLLQRV